MSAARDALARLRRHRIPAWWQDAKLGIFIHWTIASVPAFAPVGTDFATLLKSGDPDAYSRTPYVEWYQNSLRFQDSPVARHHREVYGNRPYESFREEWEAGLAEWDPQEWARRIAGSGARYVVLVAKHADGYCLWPTEVDNPNRPGWHSRRDVVGELAEAVRSEGLRFGLYYCGGMDWTFDHRPVGSMSDVLAAIPRGAYPAYAEAQVRELIDRYRPSVLWNDVAWPAGRARLWPLFEHYYRQVPDGVVNDRWLPWNPLMEAGRSGVAARAIDRVVRRQMVKDGGLVPPRPPHFDYRTPEYVVFPEVQTTPWECVRGMDESFGYNAFSRPEDFIGRAELLWLLADIVAKGGNLLLNIGPRGRDAQIPEEQTTRLDWLGRWMKANAPAIGGTRPWVRSGTFAGHGRTPVGNTEGRDTEVRDTEVRDTEVRDTEVRDTEGRDTEGRDTEGRDTEVRYTASGDSVFAIVRAPSGSVTLTDVQDTPVTVVESAEGTRLPWRDTPAGLEVDLPGGRAGDEPTVIVLHGVRARPVPPQPSGVSEPISP